VVEEKKCLLVMAEGVENQPGAYLKEQQKHIVRLSTFKRQREKMMNKFDLKNIVFEAILLGQQERITFSQASLQIFKRIATEDITPTQARRSFLHLLEDWKIKHPEWFEEGSHSQDINIAYYSYDDVITKYRIIDNNCKIEVDGFLKAICYIELETGFVKFR